MQRWFKTGGRDLFIRYYTGDIIYRCQVAIKPTGFVRSEIERIQRVLVGEEGLDVIKEQEIRNEFLVNRYLYRNKTGGNLCSVRFSRQNRGWIHHQTHTPKNTHTRTHTHTAGSVVHDNHSLWRETQLLHRIGAEWWGSAFNVRSWTWLVRGCLTVSLSGRVCVCGSVGRVAGVISATGRRRLL